MCPKCLLITRFEEMFAPMPVQLLGREDRSARTRNNGCVRSRRFQVEGVLFGASLVRVSMTTETN